MCSPNETTANGLEGGGHYSQWALGGRGSPLELKDDGAELELDRRPQSALALPLLQQPGH